VQTKDSPRDATLRVDIRNDLERREKTHGFGKFARARLAAHDDDILIYINFAFFLCLKMEKKKLENAPKQQEEYLL